MFNASAWMTLPIDLWLLCGGAFALLAFTLAALRPEKPEMIGAVSANYR